MFFNKLIEQVKNTPWKNPNDLELNYLHYDQCLQFATMNDLSAAQNIILTEVFSKYLAPRLGENYEKFVEIYKKLKNVLIKQGESAYSARELLHQHGLDTHVTRKIDNPHSFMQSRDYLMQLLVDTAALIPRQRSLDQFFTILNKIIHLSLSGFQGIDYTSCCNLIVEALQYACMGLARATSMNFHEKSIQFELLIDIAFAHYFLLHIKPADNKKTTFMLSTLYSSNDSGRLAVLKRMLDTADILVLHAAIIARDEPNLSVSSLILLKHACWVYEEILAWGMKYQAFAEIGTKALERIYAINQCKDNRVSIAELISIFDRKVNSLIPWQQNRSLLKKMREEAKTSLSCTAIGDTDSIVKRYNQGLIHLLHSMLTQCLTMIGRELPFAYAVLIMGSPSRDEACPYSDIEYAFLVNENTEMDNKNKKLGRMFLGLFELIVCAIGETPEIPRLEKMKIAWKSPLPKGFQMDRNFKAFSNLNNYENYQLWGNVEQLLSPASVNDSVIGTLMLSARLLFANTAGEALYTHFHDKKSEIFRDSAVINSLVSRILNKGNLYHLAPFLENPSKSLNIKDSLLRLPQFLLHIFSMKAHIDGQTILQQLEKLEQAGLFSEVTAKMIYLQWMSGLRLRYLAHFYYQEENDTLFLSPPSPFLDKNTFSVLMGLRQGVIPILYNILIETRLQPVNSNSYQSAIPAIECIAQEYFAIKNKQKAFKYYDLNLLMCNNVIKNEGNITSILKTCFGTKADLPFPGLPHLLIKSLQGDWDSPSINWYLIHEKWSEHQGIAVPPLRWNPRLSLTLNQGLRLLFIVTSYTTIPTSFWFALKKIYLLLTPEQQNTMLDEVIFWHGKNNSAMTKVVLLLRMYYNKYEEPEETLLGFTKLIVKTSDQQPLFYNILQKILENAFRELAIEGKNADFEKIASTYFSANFWMCKTGDDYQSWFTEWVVYAFHTGLTLTIYGDFLCKIPVKYRLVCLSSANTILNKTGNADWSVDDTVFEMKISETCLGEELKICLMSNDDNITALMPWISSISNQIDRVFNKQLNMFYFEEQLYDMKTTIKYWYPLQDKFSFNETIETFFEKFNPASTARAEKMKNFFRDSHAAVFVYEGTSITNKTEEITRWVIDFLEYTNNNIHRMPVLFIVPGIISDVQKQTLEAIVSKIKPTIISVPDRQYFSKIIRSHLISSKLSDRESVASHEMNYRDRETTHSKIKIEKLEVSLPAGSHGSISQKQETSLQHGKTIRPLPKPQNLPASPLSIPAKAFDPETAHKPINRPLPSKPYGLFNEHRKLPLPPESIKNQPVSHCNLDNTLNEFPH